MTMILDGTNGITTNAGTLISASTIGVGGTTPSTSGAGISFPATQSTSSNANTLDDYEEGTFTPSLSTGFTVTSGSFASTSIYTKIGNVVNFTIFQTSGTRTFTQGAFLTGLPFAPSSLCTSGSYTNGNPNVQGGVLIYGGGSVVYMASAQATQTSLVITGSYQTA